MNTTAKIIIGLIAGMFILCLFMAAGGLLLMRSAGRAVGDVIQTSQEKVPEIAGNIAEYDLPAGFGEAHATELAGFSLVAYTGDDTYSHIFLFQLPAGVHVDQTELERRFQQATGETQEQFQAMKIVERKTATIRGESVELVISEGANRDHMPYRQVSGMFPGKQGQAMVLVSAPISTWDQAMVDNFLASLR